MRFHVARALVLAVMVCTCCSGCSDVALRNLNGIPILEVSGCGAFDLGYTIGKTFAPQIRSSIKESVLLAGIKVSALAGQQGGSTCFLDGAERTPPHTHIASPQDLQQLSPSARSKVAALNTLHRRQFPQLVAELEGMAQGAGVPLDDVSNSRAEETDGGLDSAPPGIHVNRKT